MSPPNYAKNLGNEYLVLEYLKNRCPQSKDRAVQVYLPLVKYIVGRMYIPEKGALKKEDFYRFKFAH